MGAPTHAASANGNNENCNDLTNIRGIGVSRKRWLNSLGIYTITDLSQASADEIESQLKSNGRLLSRSELEEWIAQAQAVNTQHQQPSALPDSSQASLETELSASSLTPSPQAVSATNWNSIAVFKVEFQTRQTAEQPEQRTVIHDLETNATEEWSGFETQLIQQWMLDRIATPSLSAKAADPVILQITQLRVIQADETAQPLVADQTHPLFPQPIPINQPFALEVSMQLMGLSNTKLPDHIPCSVQCVVHDVSVGSNTTLGEVIINVLPKNNATYKALLPGLMLSRPSIYRLKVLVTLQNSQAIDTPIASGSFKIPMLQVV